MVYNYKENSLNMETIVIKAKPSLFGLMIPVGFISFFLFMIAKLYPILARHTTDLIIFIIVHIGMIGLFFFLMVIQYTMRYELKPDALYLKCGPFTCKILYTDIKKVIKTDLIFHPIASCRYPGFALGNCYYTDWGNVHMYSTRMCNDVILIITNNGLYGVTPRDEELFITNLKIRIEKIDRE